MTECRRWRVVLIMDVRTKQADVMCGCAPLTSAWPDILVVDGGHDLVCLSPPICLSPPLRAC